MCNGHTFVFACVQALRVHVLKPEVNSGSSMGFHISFEIGSISELRDRWFVEAGYPTTFWDCISLPLSRITDRCSRAWLLCKVLVIQTRLHIFTGSTISTRLSP